jgi:CheY-like chemotaxis protein/HD-like signal output (HDOD) protein
MPPDSTRQSPSVRRVFIVDDQALIREPIAVCLSNAGYEVLTASSGQQALETLAHTTPDLILLDVHMPGIDGFELLAAIRGRPALARVHVVLLTSESGRHFVLRASALGVRDYLLKDRFALKELLARVRRYFESPTPAGASSVPAGGVEGGVVDAAALHPLLAREQVIDRVRNALQGKSLSGTVAQVIQLAASPRTSMGDLASLVAKDPMLSASVLRVSNSAAYASTKSTISTIPEAIKKIGCAAVGGIAAAVAVIDAMPETLADGFNPVRAWQHSFAVARVCQHLIAEENEGGSVAYLVGLCHDLGDILFHAQFAPECQHVRDLQARTGKPRAELERLLLGISQAELVPLILSQLGLPEIIRGPIVEFHRAAAAVGVPVEPLARIVWLAESYANGMLLASSAAGAVCTVAKSFCAKATSKPEPPCPVATMLRTEVFCLTAMLARFSPRDDAALAAPLLPRRNVRICLVRGRAFSSFDPLAAALDSLAEVRIVDQVSAVPEAQLTDAVVVAGDGSSAGGPVTAVENRGAAAVAGLPTLWVPRGQGGGTNFATSPITLSELERFIAKVEAREAQAAA